MTSLKGGDKVPPVAYYLEFIAIELRIGAGNYESYETSQAGPMKKRPGVPPRRWV